MATRGGRRRGTPGRAYTNRTDLQGAQLPVSAPRGLPYGDRAKLIAAQRQVPMGSPGAPAPAGSPAGAPAAGPPTPIPGQMPGFGSLTAPTQRPGEPVTAGLPTGPGAGPEVLSANNQPRVSDPAMQAVAVLDALGDTADQATKGIRDAVHASIANRSVP